MGIQERQKLSCLSIHRGKPFPHGIVSRKTGDVGKQPLHDDRMNMSHTPQACVAYQQPVSVDGSVLSKSSRLFLSWHKESSSILQKNMGIPELTQETTVYQLLLVHSEIKPDQLQAILECARKDSSTGDFGT
ncbi:hypothetical protein llap_10255 [Limosa lapponica baueri]|uniref:Uncharacterized protein n=1 Tax=Limosa lapponica baueri TaxID=1758121 RepID=A0A2I0U098_LIMLA|nr:hypothetical protein llap_10255 [Limosa lapponica baueri]